MTSLLFKNAQIVTMDSSRNVIFGNLLIENDQIKAIGDRTFFADKEIDLNGKIIIPGLIQTHVHLAQTLFRGQADDLALLDWLSKKIWPMEAAHDAYTLYYSALLGICELFRNGTTSIVDMATVHYTDSVFQAMTETGIRAIGGKCMMDTGNDVPPRMMESTGKSIQDSVDLLEKWHGSSNNRIQYAFNPRFVLSCSKEMLLEIRDLSEKNQVLIHSHAAENEDETKAVKQSFGKGNIHYLADLGLTGERLILAHCIWVDDEELEILKESGTKVVHCPSSNLKLGSGIARITTMQEMGISISLGADGAPCNNNMDPFMEMRLAALLQKPFFGPTAMPAEKAFEMVTLGGAKAMGLETQIGSIEPGKKADLAILDLDRAHSIPATGSNIYNRLVYEAQSSDVVLTMVDGRIVFENGTVQTIDEKEVYRGSERLIRKILTRLGAI
ncbi:MAG: 5'-deoxyadenosine deaminase [Bacillota bacterium]|nr:5'-deoxyadenosine deaminase [Bacillota bacterium]